MPDWSYQSLFRPLLFKLPAAVARGLTLRAIGGLSRLPGGSLIIRTLGHMESSPLLRLTRCGIDFDYPVGLAGMVDPHGTAHRALAQFGLGFIEVGPVTVLPIEPEVRVSLDRASESLVYGEPLENDGLEAVAARMNGRQGHALPFFFRIRPMPGASGHEAIAEIETLLARLQPFAAGFYLDLIEPLEQNERNERNADDSCFVSPVVEAVAAARRLAPGSPLFLYVPPAMDHNKLTELLRQLDENGLFCDGAVIGAALRTPAGWEAGPGSKEDNLAKLRLLKRLYGDRLAVIASGGIREPQDALDCRDAGADLLLLGSGLVYSGPGLPKRINEALLHRIVRREPSPALQPFWSGWGWMCLLGLGMVIGGILAWIVASTTVVLPYDLKFLWASPAAIKQLNGRLLPFMSHDRITLAGTMISIGILYAQLGRYGLRERLHWARTALMASGIVGFGSFLLFLGYGFFDPLHAVAAAVLLPMFLLAMRDRSERPSQNPVNLRNDRSWRLAQRGQFMMVSLGFALAVGGLTIAYVGITDVFVPEDLSFLMTSASRLGAANGNLLPLIAHDRAGFGGALFSDAVALLAISLWGIQQGQRWLWWTYLLAGLPAFVAGFSVHFQIGYIDLWHLSPAIAALALYVCGLIWLYPYLMRSSPAAEPSGIRLAAGGAAD